MSISYYIKLSSPGGQRFFLYPSKGDCPTLIPHALKLEKREMQEAESYSMNWVDALKYYNWVTEGYLNEWSFCTGVIYTVTVMHIVRGVTRVEIKRTIPYGMIGKSFSRKREPALKDVVKSFKHLKMMALREQLNWTIRHLAKKSDLSEAYISDLEAGKRRNPSFEAVEKIANAFGVNVLYLLNEEVKYVTTNMTLRKLMQGVHSLDESEQILLLVTLEAYLNGKAVKAVERKRIPDNDTSGGEGD